jgi:3D (Asp-Asp-Asp) domain-containing protein
MRNIARGSVILFLVTLLVGVSYFQAKVEAVTIVAKDSQENIQTDISELNLEESNNIEKYDFNIEVEDSSEEAEAVSAESNARAFKATAYCLRGKTASGRMVRRGIVAADPRVLRLGTRIHLSGGRYTGNYIVADTGGKIKGRVLDIWVPSCAEARRWGRRTVKVKVVGKRRR